MTQGFILGRFNPLHMGHIFLIESALKRCDKLCILVCSTKTDEIPGWLRYSWVKNSFPALEVLHILDLEESDFVQRFKRIYPENGANRILFDPGKKYASLALELGLQQVDLETMDQPPQVSSDAIRKSPAQYESVLPPQVKAYYLKRVALVGPESCGKSYLAAYLAGHFNTVYVEEYGRSYCEKFGMDSSPLDFAHVAGGQLYLEDEMALKAQKVLFCDTELIVTQVWSEVYFGGTCQPWIFWADHARSYDLFLLCAPDIPWVNDGLRQFEAQRHWMFERLRQELEARNLRYVLIQGSYEARNKTAIHAVTQLLRNGLNIKP